MSDSRAASPQPATFNPITGEGFLYTNCPCPYDPECDCSFAEFKSREEVARCASMTWEDAFGGAGSREDSDV